MKLFTCDFRTEITKSVEHCQDPYKTRQNFIPETGIMYLLPYLKTVALVICISFNRSNYS